MKKSYPAPSCSIVFAQLLRKGGDFKCPSPTWPFGCDVFAGLEQSLKLAQAEAAHQLGNASQAKEWLEALLPLPAARRALIRQLTGLRELSAASEHCIAAATDIPNATWALAEQGWLAFLQGGYKTGLRQKDAIRLRFNGCWRGSTCKTQTCSLRLGQVWIR